MKEALQLAPEVALVLFGWLLGLLGPPIGDSIRRHYRRKDLRESLCAELKEIQHDLVVTASTVLMHQGTFDAGFLSWAFPLIER